MGAGRGRQTLGSAADFKRVLRKGQATDTSDLMVHVLTRGDSAAGRYGLVVSKKHGGAVVRNRIRRQARAAVLRAGVPCGVDLVVVPKAGRRLSVARGAEQVAAAIATARGTLTGVDS